MNVDESIGVAVAAMELVKSIALHAPVGIQIYDADGYTLYTNPQHHRIFGAAPPPGYCVLKDSLVEQAGTLHLVHQAFSGTPAQLPLIWYDPGELALDQSNSEYTKKYGRKCAVETKMIPVLDAFGKVANVVFIFRDVTGELFMQEERKRAFKERDDARVLIQSVLDQTQAVVYIKDREGKFIFANGQFLRIFGLSQEQVIGKSDYELFPKDVADAFRRNDLHVLEAETHLEAEEAAVHADGSAHSYLSLKFPARDSTGKLFGTCGVSTDITQHRQLERELSTSKRMEAVGLLAGGIAHNFNNILGVILLVADTLLMRDRVDASEFGTSIATIKSAAQSAALLTRQLLTFGRDQRSEPRAVDLGDVLAGVEDILKNALGEDIHFSVHVGKDLWRVRTDPIQVEQILTNLCFNAKDAMPRGGKLRISLSNARLGGEGFGWRIGKPQGDYVELSVTDTGQGIQSEHIDRIFEPFFTTKQDGRSTGLGLATVYQALQKSRGDIAVESVPNKGTTFRICFPKQEGDFARSKAAKKCVENPQRGTETLLLIEDQSALRHATATLLRDRGYTVIEARDEESALAAWNSGANKVDLVISDIVMPDSSGPEILQKMSKASKQVPVRALFVSAYSDKKLLDYSFDPSQCHFIEKPYTADELLKKIRMVLVPVKNTNL